MATDNTAPQDTPRKETLLTLLGGAAQDNTIEPLNKLIHEPTRLAILSALAVNDTLTFGELKDTLQTSDGNVSVHARKLEDAGLVLCKKSFQGRVPRTVYRLSPSGKQTLARYLDHMEALIRTVRGE